ncbi:hypothetical protein N1851_007187 [Merluccius polli]|uniref:Uncharacterized protein n=1 Tax=Merluccius polli TaxID=89951 RepID=A0AA47N3F4_MERPO|nr:hypothetical protein N1851_007187 [Merluccius polli]
MLKRWEEKKREEERLSPPTHLAPRSSAGLLHPDSPTGPSGAGTSRRSTVARGRGNHPRPGRRQVAVRPLRLLREPRRNGALPRALRPGGHGRPGQTPSPSLLDVLFQTQFQNGLRRACSKPCKRCAEGRSAFTVHDQAKERRVGPAESSERLNALCPVRALRVYVDRTDGFRKSEQLFVSCATSHLATEMTETYGSRIGAVDSAATESVGERDNGVGEDTCSYTDTSHQRTSEILQICSAILQETMRLVLALAWKMP